MYAHGTFIGVDVMQNMRAFEKLQMHLAVCHEVAT